MCANVRASVFLQELTESCLNQWRHCGMDAGVYHWVACCVQAPKTVKDTKLKERAVIFTAADQFLPELSNEFHLAQNGLRTAVSVRENLSSKTKEGARCCLAI